jgi:hypothetical protein
MRIDPRDGGPDDWFVPGPTGGNDGYPDDWFVPEQAQGVQGDGYPNDWFVPASSALNTQQGVAGLGAASPATTNRPAQPDPFAAYWARMPASRVGASLWQQPVIGNGAGAFSPVTASSLFGGLATPQSAGDEVPPFAVPTSPQLANGRSVTASSLFGGITPFKSETAAALPPLTANAARFDASDDVDHPPLGWQSDSAVEPSELQQKALEQGDWSRGVSGFPSQTTYGLDGQARASAANARGGSAAGPSQASFDQSVGPGSISRVVRDARGRPLAIVHLEPDQSGSLSDASPEGLQPGSRYAQNKINNASTGNPLIDRTTEFLLDALAQTARAIGPGRGPVFGIRVHTDFGRRVKALDLPGIGEDGVEQSFHFNFPEDVAYGFQNSIRTDVALTDPKNPARGPIVVYDLKTGNAVLTARRAAEIRAAFDKVLNGKQNGLPIIVLRYTTLDTAFPRGSGPSGGPPSGP